MSSESKDYLDVLVYGLGAIGGFYAFVLSKAPNVRLSVIARSNYDAVKEHGLRMKSENHGEHVIRPYKVLRNAAEAQMKFDYIICAHKAINQDETPSQIAAGIDERVTTLVIIQNGVGNEEPFRSSFKNLTIISCVTWVGAIQKEPGEFTQMKSEDMQIGLYPNEGADSSREKQRLDHFSSLLTAGNTVFQVVDNIQVQRWEKVVWNVAWNSLTTLTLLDTQSWLSSSEEAKPMTRRLMIEVINVARACGVAIQDSLADDLINKVLGMPPIGSSMQNDYKAGRAMEVEIILGTPFKKAKKLGVSTPTLDTIYIIMVGSNRRLIQGSKI